MTGMDSDYVVILLAWFINVIVIYSVFYVLL